MAHLLSNEGYAILYNENFASESKVLCLIDTTVFIQSVERLTSYAQFSPENIEHLSCEMIREVALDFLYFSLSIVENTNEELRVKRVDLMPGKSASLRQKPSLKRQVGRPHKRLVQDKEHENHIEEPTVKRPVGRPRKRPVLDKEHENHIEEDADSKRNITEKLSMGFFPGKEATPESNVFNDSSEHGAHNEKCQPVPGVDTFHSIDSSHPISGVDSSRPVPALNICQSVSADDSFHSESGEDRSHPVPATYICQSVSAVDSSHSEFDVDSIHPPGPVSQNVHQIVVQSDSGENNADMDSAELEPHADSETSPKYYLRKKSRMAKLADSNAFSDSDSGTDDSEAAVDNSGDWNPDRSSSESEADDSDIPIDYSDEVKPEHKRGNSVKKCSVCSEQFDSNRKLGAHMRKHFEQKPFQCEVCGMTVMSRCTLKQHFRTAHSGEKPFICSTCDKTFSTKMYLNKHMFVHSGERPHICEVCGKGYRTKTGLKDHSTKHTKEMPYKCKLCDTAFSTSGSLKIHFASHAERRRFWFKCEICNKEFVVKDKFKIHMRLHTGEKPYLCDLCGKGFASTCYLAQHRKIHDEASYTCSKCGKSYSWAHTLQQHSKSCVGTSG